MKLAKNAEVYSSDGEKIGLLDRVVLDPGTKEVTHLVVEKGILFTTNKVIPIQYVNTEVGDQITLSKAADELQDLPSYDKSAYISSDVAEDLKNDKELRTVYWYPPLATTWWATGAGLYQTSTPQYVRKEYLAKMKNVIPDGTIALEEGADVIGADDEKLGSVERVIVESTENRATHIVVGSGLFMKEFKLVPTLWIKDVVEDKVYTTVRSDFFESLPEHELVA